jgi:hypothetical protein
MVVGLSISTVTAGFVGGVAMFDAGCIIPDYCIRIQTHGKNNCNYLTNAMMWPAEQPELAVPVPASHDAPGPAGCVCYNAAEQEILDFEVPPGKFAEFMDELEAATRDECDAIVPPGWDHNCYITEGTDASTAALSKPFQGGFGECIGSCVFTNPPPGDTCPELTPYECDEDDGETGGVGETGADTVDAGTGMNAGDYIYCVGNSCDISLGFAQMLSENMEMLQREGATFVYDASIDRFVLQGVARGTVAFELGLASGDVLESVNDTTIGDLDSALQAMVENRDATELNVRVKRGRRWIDFTYTLAP